MLQKRTMPVAPLDSPSLGESLRICRKEASLTMQTVADSAGLSVGFISQVERDLCVPSLSSLRAICGALGKPVSYFLDPPDCDVSTTRQSARVEFSVGEGSLSYERISTRFPGSVLRSVLVHEPPGYRTEPISHEGEEIFYMLRGALTVEIEGQRSVLREGDSIHFDARQVHATWNHGTETATLLWCGTMDLFGEEADGPVHRGGQSAKTNIHLNKGG